MKKLKLKEISLSKKLFLDTIIKIVENLRLRIVHQNLFRLYKFLLSFKANVIFIIEEKGWVIEWEAKFITNNLRKLKLIDTEIASNFLVKKKIIHWGSINCLIRPNGLARFNSSNVNVLTWYHIVPGDVRIKYLPYLEKKIDVLHTACELTKTHLVNYGFNENKIVVIPTGVDINLFKRFENQDRVKLRKKYKIPLDKFIIGSFVKDGIGWGDGMEPKLIKGPDIFVEVVRKLNENFDIHILITGPSRGYVKSKLKEYKIPFTFVYLNNYFDMVECYNVIDLYLITSRVEGGPKGSLEAMASGVPIVSTKVGWVPEVIKNGYNGFVADVDDTNGLYNYILELIENKELRNNFIINNLKIIQNYRWENVAKNYYSKIYKQFIDQ